MEISIGSGTSDLPQLVTAWAALFAALLGPLAGYLAARHQAHRSIVSANRQKWVDELRAEISDFIVECSSIGLKSDTNNPFRSSDPTAKVRDHFLRLDRLISVIELRLNPTEDDHRELLEALRQCLEASVNHDGYAAAKEVALKCAKKVLKREWEVVKAGR